MEVPGHVIIDDRDPMVHYLGRWNEGGMFPEFDGTTHGVIDDGSQAILNFTGARKLLTYNPRS